tara:strand:- start:1266 stop:1454 length:189 start_codon:yes stop_codon:yes gene_type:complete
MRSPFCLLAILLLVACNSTSLTSINGGSDPKWVGEVQYEVFVAIRLYNPELRVMFQKKWSKN